MKIIDRIFLHSWFTAVTALVLVSWAVPATAKDDFKFDPASCKEDSHGKIYIAIGSYVLALSPPNALTYIDELHNTDTRLVPPDLADPEGCPGNPRQLRGYGYSNYGNNIGLLTKKGIPFQLEILRVPDTEWIAERGRQDFAEQTCHLATTQKEELPNGLSACRIMPKEHEDHIEDWAASYVARPDVYKTPLSKPFVAYCGPELFTPPAIGRCEVGYTIRPGLGVLYNFQPYLGSHHIPINDLIDFDRGLRVSIDTALVKNFVWPDQPADGNSKPENHQ
jgi:hypothetical protein